MILILKPSRFARFYRFIKIIIRININFTELFLINIYSSKNVV